MRIEIDGKPIDSVRVSVELADGSGSEAILGGEEIARAMLAALGESMGSGLAATVPLAGATVRVGTSPQGGGSELRAGACVSVRSKGRDMKGTLVAIERRADGARCRVAIQKGPRSYMHVTAEEGDVRPAREED